MFFKKTFVVLKKLKHRFKILQSVPVNRLLLCGISLLVS